MSDKFKDIYRIPTARATWHDYRSGTYFVTICTLGREVFLGNIVQTGDEAQMILSAVGKETQRCIEQIHQYHPSASVLQYVILPNHVHLIVRLEQNDRTPATTTHNTFGVQSHNLASVIRGVKAGVTAFARNNNISFEWQSRYHDHIIRTPEELTSISMYIRSNVRNWHSDCFNQ